MIALIPEREVNQISFTWKEKQIVETNKNIDENMDKINKTVKSEVAAGTDPVLRK